LTGVTSIVSSKMAGLVLTIHYGRLLVVFHSAEMLF